MKKILCFILSMIMFSTAFMTAFAAETDINNESMPAIEDKSMSYDGETFFFDAGSGEILTENGEPFAFEDVKFEIPVSDERIEDEIAPAFDLFEIYIVRGGLKKTSGGKYTWWFNVDCPTSPFVKPHIKLTAQLRGNFTTGTTFSNVGNSVYHEYYTNTEYGVDYTWTSNAKTGYYRFSYTLTDYDANGQTQYRTTDSQLWNRTGHVWNFYYNDSSSGKSLPKPPANYLKGAAYTRPSNLANTYYTNYKNKTGITLDSSLYDVHHIRPLAYGGDNSYNNLIHLPKSLHKNVTGWWAGY